MEQAAEDQFVTDVERGYALYLNNCQTCHGDNGQGGIGPPLNNQPKLYNALTSDGQAGTGHHRSERLGQTDIPDNRGYLVRGRLA
jgi:mono/diheme cytochrome c family protein